MTSCCLSTLAVKAYQEYLHKSNDNAMDYPEWRDTNSEQHPQFKYWMLTLKFEMDVLLLIQISLCINKLCNVSHHQSINLFQWFLSLDHYNYARWVSVHIRDMTTLNTTHPNIEEEFKLGNFVIHKTQ